MERLSIRVYNIQISLLYSQNQFFLTPSNRSDVLVIDPKTDENACVQCTYFITVASVRPSMYSLMLALESTIPKLSDGHPVSDHVNWLQTNKYTFADSFGAGRDIRIKLTTISGDAVT